MFRVPRMGVLPQRRVRTALAAVTTFACLAALAPASASAFQKAIWGPPYRHGKDEFALYRKLGVTLYETNINWAAVATRRASNPTDPDAPAYHWPAYLQQEVTLARKYKMSVMIQVKGSPAWANGGHTDGSGVTGEEWAPTDAADYANFVEAVARKYLAVHFWMIWGEPTRGGDFEPMQAVDNPADDGSSTAITPTDVTLAHR